jgi:hypothetical protein
MGALRITHTHSLTLTPFCPQKISAALGVTKVRLKDYESTGWRTNPKYAEEAVKFITDEFPFLNVGCIKKVLEGDNHKGHYASFVKELIDVMGYTELQLAKGGARVSDSVRQKLKVRSLVVVKNGRTRKLKIHGDWRPSDPILRDEIEYVKQKYNNNMEVADVEFARALARDEAEVRRDYVIWKRTSTKRTPFKPTERKN